jgi:hypothetical protein
MQVGGLIKVKLKKKFEIDGICINKKAGMKIFERKKLKYESTSQN